MGKKFFDILPPKTEPRRSRGEGEYKNEALIASGMKKEKPVLNYPVINGASKEFGQKKKSRGNGIFFGASFLIIIVALGAFLYFNLAKATVEIWPETKTLNFETELAVAEKEIDPSSWLAQKSIPGKMLSQEKETDKEFTSSGVIEKKEFARGKIKINNKSKNPITLIKNTRFLSDEGKQFHSLKEVTVAAKGSAGGIEVEADGAGEDYNIGPSKFSIPNLRKYSSALFYEIWAESSEPMKGGFQGSVSQVTEDDIKNADNAVVEKLFADGKESLKNVDSEYVLLDGALEQKLVEKSPLAKAGQELQSFVFHAKIKSSGLAFKKSDLEKLSRDFVYSQISADKKLVEKSLNLNYSVKEKDLEQGKIIISLKISGDIYSDINLQTLKNKIKGKSASDGNNFLGKDGEISKVNIKLWPPFVRRVPNNDGRIEIKLKVD